MGRFTALLGGELLKVRRQPANRPLLIVPLLVVVLLALLSSGSRPPGDANDVALRVLDPLTLGLQVGLGIPLLVLGARATGQEYQLGTIRVLIARGAGRVRLLLARVTALLVLAAVATAAMAVVGFVILALAEPRIVAPLLQPGAALLRDAGLNLVAVVLSLAACTLLATFAAALGRSVVFGIGVALVWFPVENLAAVTLTALSALTHRDVFDHLTAYLLSTNLNVMVQALEPWRTSEVLLATPGVPVDGTHTVLVAAGYLVAFLAASILLTWRRDVQQ
ncbi:MAG TPA: ABC transporter permease [Candidatus Dormibacteraeota bacterium]|nr:ABC transporter permease [Candidatus Dormibacteraeota bacterium]